MEWYLDTKNELYEIENSEDNGITVLMGHIIQNEKWEYAIVSYIRGSSILLATFVDGKVHEK